MKRRQWSKVVATVTAAAMALGGLVTNPDALMQVQAETDNYTYVDDAKLDEIAANQGTVIGFTRDAVHDPSIVVSGDNYYVFGSHMGVSKTTNLRDWKNVTGEKVDSPLFGTVSGNDPVKTVSYGDAFRNNAYTGKVTILVNGMETEVDFGSYDASSWNTDQDVKDKETGLTYNVQGNMWAPDVIYNPTMNKWCMYLSLNGARWNSSIILLTADELEGPYIYQGPVLYSGFNGTNMIEFLDTDLDLVYPGITEIPAKYVVGESWGDIWPHAIDPCVSYDENGKLWLIYGSWSGGIYALELDEATGLRDYTVVYEDDYNSTNPKAVTSDKYFGKKIAGGAYVSGEGAYVEKIGNYWYLFMSYGFYSPTGGYEMRIFRSENINGPYKDASGDSAIYPNWVKNFGAPNAIDKTVVTYGEKLMGGYKWDTMSKGEIAQGHNSVFTDTDGNSYVVYHTKFNDGTADHQLRVHQLFVNKDGWLVAAPYEYTGETVNNDTLATTTFETSEIAGEYQVIVHKYEMDYEAMEIVTPSVINLVADGTITGAYTGTWEVVEGSYVNITLGGITYGGVLVEQIIDGTVNKTLCFTAKSGDGVSVWGSKTVPDTAAIAFTRDALGLTNANNIFPIGGDIYFDVTLPTNGSMGATVKWTSSNEDVLTSSGVVTVPATDTDVTLTCQIVKGSTAYKKSYDVTVKGESSRNGDIATGLVAKFEFEGDFKDSLSSNIGTAIAQASGTKPSLRTDKDLNSGVVQVNFGYNDVSTSNYVEILNPLKGITTDAMTISMQVKRSDADVWDALWGLVGSGGRFYLTGNAYLGYNDGVKDTKNWYDVNHSATVTNAIPVGEWSLVTITADNTGYEIYVDGALTYDETYSKSYNCGAEFAGHSTVMDMITSADTFYLGYGSWWGSAPFRADDLCFYDRVLSAADVAALYDELTAKLAGTAGDDSETDSGVLTGRQYAEIEQSRTYYNDFEDGLGDAAIVGDGELKTVEDTAYGQVYQNATGTPRTNYLLLPSDTIKNAAMAGNKEMTVGFWVNAGDANVANYFFAPIFSAYGEAPDATAGNGMPMMVLQSRLLAQLNCAGWTDFTATENVAGENQESNAWLGDGAWHYYAASFSEELVTVYVDGVVMNQWEVSGANGNSVSGLFTAGDTLDYISLGGNQAWTWGDADAPYMYDRVSLFSIALTSDEVKTVMAEEGKDRTIDEITDTRTYYNNFENGLGDATVNGSGGVETAEDTDFGSVYHNATSNVGIRTNYLMLPEDTIANAAKDVKDGMTIGFWVNSNGENLNSFYYAPLFSAYKTAPAGGVNGMPMLIFQSRLIGQMNCNGWTDLTAAENLEGVNIESNLWLSDGEWHYYTATIQEQFVTVYVDGEVLNQWEVDATKVGGLFTDGSELKYVCLGGNQAWDWGDADAPYLYDEVSLFSTALTQGEIAKVMAETKKPETVKVAKDRAYSELETYKTFFIDFEDGLEETKVVGSGEIQAAKNTSFGKVYHNATGELGIRKNYLVLPSDTIANAIVDEEMSIGFWVNVADAKDYYWTPLFTAYGDAPSADNVNTFPFMALQSRLVGSVNCTGYTDLTDGENVAKTNKLSTAWLDDFKWHYYTATFEEDSICVYVDGVLQNEWKMSLLEKNRVKGLLYDGALLDYVCLGGNQALDWADRDSSYMFDDVSVYSTALTAGEIAEIIKAKNVTDSSITEQPDPTPSPTEEPTEAPTSAPSEAPTSAPSAGPGATEVPTATPSVTEAPVVTDTPAPTAEPTATPVPEVSMSTLIQETNVVMNKLTEAESAEEVADIIDEYIDNVVGAWAGAETLTNEELSVLAKIEETIKEAMEEICDKQIYVDVQLAENSTFEAHKIENALLTVPTGGHLVVSPATLASGRQDLASKLDVSAEQLADAEVFDLHLVDGAGNKVALEAPVRVHFNIPERMLSKKLKMLHFLDNNGVELLDVTVDGNQGSFITESFSEFALVAVGDIANDNNNDSQKNEDSVVDTIIGAMSPKTGDLGQNSIAPWVQLVLLGMMFVVAAVTGSAILRKKEEE